MSFTDLHLTAPLARALNGLGWDAGDPLVRDTAPTAARGHNLVVVTPPAPGYVMPTLAGLLSRPGDAGAVLALVPAETVGEWAPLVAQLTQGSPGRTLVAAGPAQASRHLAAGVDGLLVMSPETALGLLRRSRLPTDRLGAVLLVRPEAWPEPEALAELMQDLPRERQRVLVTADAERGAPLIERYAWRALSVGDPVAGHDPVPPVRTLEVPWSGRVQALPRIVEALDPDSLAVWTLDRSRHPEIAGALAGLPAGPRLVTGTPAPADVIVAFDPPTRAILAGMTAHRTVVALVPPGTETYLASVAGAATPLDLAAGADRAPDETARRRRQIARVIRDDDLERGRLALAPLLETHGPGAVAAAAYQLWAEAERPRPEAAAPAAAPSATARLWAGGGKRDEAGASDLVGLMANQLRVDRSQIGKVDVRETYSLVEVPAEAAERIARGLTGRTLRRRRLVARVDRGPERGPSRGR